MKEKNMPRWFTIRGLPIDLSSLLRGVGVGVIVGGYLMERTTLTAVEMTAWVGIPLGLLGHFVSFRKP